MEVINTYIVIDESGIQTLYATWTKWFITTHIVGRLKEISDKEAHELIKKTLIP
jgi:hypothetical protein